VLRGAQTSAAPKGERVASAEVSTEPAALAAPQARYIARQPILDRQLRTVGYELLYRSGAANEAHIEDFDQATDHVASSALLTWGLDTLVGTRPAFVNVTGRFLRDGTYRLFPPERLVLEIVEDTPVDTTLIEAACRARDAGYRLALDDYLPGRDHDRLVSLVDVIKLEVVETTTEALGERAAFVKALNPDVRLVAEKVEDPVQFRACADIGFDLFQGYFFARPEVLSRRTPPVRLSSTLELFRTLDDPACSIEQAVGRVSEDAVLAYRVLQLAGSGAFGLRSAPSLQLAVVAVGLQTLRQLVLLAALGDQSAATESLLTLATTRARLAYGLAEWIHPAMAEQAFLAGLLSVADVLFGTPMELLVNPLPIAREIKDALVRGSGPLADLLSAAVGIEQGRSPHISKEIGDVQRLYVEAVTWADSVTAACR